MRIAIALATLLLPGVASARTWEVPTDAPTIQAGIDSAAAGDTVRVACGTYYEHNISMKSGIALRSATGDPACVTIDAQLLGRVLYCDGVDSTSSIEGFGITGGSTATDGGGVYCVLSSPRIANCEITGNTATVYGGGLMCAQSEATIEDCVFSANSAADGGGVYCSDCSPSFTRCTFSENDATDFWGRGGGVHCENSSATLDHCIFEANTARAYGAGMSCKSYSAPTLTHCTLRGNGECTYGGGMCSEFHCSPRVVHCTFYENSAGFAGGGIYSWDNSNLTVINSTFYGDSAAQVGGGICSLSNSVLAIQNTIIAFAATGGAVFWDDTTVGTFVCSNLYGNTGGDWTGYAAGQIGVFGNIGEDPLFCDSGTHDFHLMPGSPCAPGTDPNPECPLIGSLGVGCGEWNGITTISDVPDDQGGQARVTWAGHASDNPASLEPVSEYSVWRRVDQKADGDESPARDLAMNRYPPGTWEHVLTVPALGETTYAAVCPTVCDSTIAEGMCWTVLYVIAHTDDPSVHYECDPDSGYSVDNLEPGAPQNLTADNDGDTIVLHWDAGPEEDFAYYAIYRGEEEGFVLGEPIAYSTDDTWADNAPGPGPNWYKVTATDFAGNESAPSAAASPGMLDVEHTRAAPATFFVGPATPNPFNPATEIRYGIPAGSSPSPIRMSIFDARGRRVTTLVDDVQGPGTYRVVWDGRDAQGLPVASGVYFYRLVWNDRAEARRVLLLK